jgi:hypothetical protein
MSLDLVVLGLSNGLSNVVANVRWPHFVLTSPFYQLCRVTDWLTTVFIVIAKISVTAHLPCDLPCYHVTYRKQGSKERTNSARFFLPSCRTNRRQQRWEMEAEFTKYSSGFRYPFKSSIILFLIRMIDKMLNRSRLSEISRQRMCKLGLPFQTFSLLGCLSICVKRDRLIIISIILIKM